MPELRQEYLDILEKREWSVSGYTDDGRVELEWWSPAGEDFLVCVNVENFPDEILDYSDDFDPDEHIEMWVEARANGRQDVPGARRLAKDAEDIQKELDELAFELQETERKLWLTGITAPSARRRPTMSEVKIKELDKSLIHQANSNSMSGKRGDISAHEYEVYCQKVMSWNIPDSRKQKIVDQIYAKWSEQLRHEAAHVSVAVAGPARYNAKKLDHSDTILRLSSEFVEWFNGLQEQVWQGRIEDKDAKEIARLVDDIKFCIERPTLNPTASLCELANKDPELFMEYYEKLHEKYRWRKNSVIAKLYAAGKEGKLANLNRQKFFEDENLVAYTMGDRAYIKFVMKPRQQLIVALKSRKWWWNSYEEAWSTYLNKLDKEWVQNISTRYADYV